MNQGKFIAHHDNISILKQRVKNRFMIVEATKGQHRTIEYRYKDYYEYKNKKVPHINLSPTVIKYLENVMSKKKGPQGSLRRLKSNSSLKTKDLYCWTLDGKSRTIETKSKSINTEKYKKIAKKSKSYDKKYTFEDSVESNLKNLSLELYSRMINSFRNSYMSQKNKSDLPKTQHTIFYSFDGFRKSYLQKKLPSTLMGKTYKKQNSVSLPKGNTYKLNEILTKKDKKSVLDLYPTLEIRRPKRKPEKESSLEGNQIRLKWRNNYDKPWRTNFKFPQLQSTPTIEPAAYPPSKRNFTPWRRTEEYDDLNILY